MRSVGFKSGYLPLAGAVGYFILASTTILLTSSGHSHATVWPADAVILALLLCSPRKLWPAILAAGWLGNLGANGVIRGWSAGIGAYGAINMAQTFLVARLLQKTGSAERPLEDGRSTIYFLLFAGILAPLCGATLGSLVSLLFFGEPFLPSFLRWFSSNSLGFLIATPFLKAIVDGRFASAIRDATSRKTWEATALMIGHATVTTAVFTQNRLPLLFVPTLSLLVLSFRLGRLGTKAGVIVVALCGAVAAHVGGGPFALMDEGATFTAIFFQLYLGAILCTALPVAAVVAAREDEATRVSERADTLRLIMSHSSDAILCFDRQGICRWADGKVEELLGFRRADAINLSVFEILDLIENAEFGDWLERSARSNGECPKLEFIAARRPQLTLEASIGLLTQVQDHLASIVTIRDVTAEKAREAALARIAEVDDLTGIFNRKGFRAELEAALRSSQTEFCLALVDIDNFKAVNDTFGHSIGDHVLNEVALRLKAGSRPEDVVGRMGGDEFAILFRCDLHSASAACDRIVQTLRSAPVIDDGKLHLVASISCGIAPWRKGMSRGQLFDAADAALYAVKRDGRDGVRSAA